jgi:hypothetical protein
MSRIQLILDSVSRGSQRSPESKRSDMPALRNGQFAEFVKAIGHPGEAMTIQNVAGNSFFRWSLSRTTIAKSLIRRRRPLQIPALKN